MNRSRRAIAGLLGAPLMFIFLWLWPMTTLASQAQRLAAIMGMVFVLWATEAIPLAMTALLGACACVLLGIGSADEVFGAFGHPVVFLLIGSLMLSKATEVHGLNRWVAERLLSISFAGRSPVHAMWTVGLVSVLVSMWMTNTGTTALMYPIALSLLPQDHRTRPPSRYASLLLLMVAFGASVGGLGTPVGTPTNLIGIGFIERLLNRQIHFGQWMLLGLPVMGCLFLTLCFWFGVMNRRATAIVTRPQRTPSPLTPGQRNVALAFGLTVLLWLLPSLLLVLLGRQHPWVATVDRLLPEAVPALLGVGLLMLLPDRRQARPTLIWEEAVQIDWGVCLLFGGGVAFGQLIFATGLGRAIGEALVAATGAQSALALVILSTVLATLISELTSNTASANLVVPIAIGLAQAAGIDPLAPALGATIGASLGFMLPISTPPNAIVYSSGLIPIGRMIRSGLFLDLVGIATTVGFVSLLAPLLD